MTPAARLTRRVGYVGMLVALVSTVGISAHSTPPAVASSTTSSLSVYLDAPFVQGSYVTQDVLSMSFNGPTGLGQCGDGEPAGITITGTCVMVSPQSHGGATADATNAVATVGGAGSNFPSTVNNTDPITITLANNSRYVGLWWPSGSPGNVLKFYDDTTLLLTVTSVNIVELLGTQGNTAQNWLDRNNDTDVITSIGGTKHRKVWYFGNPRGYASTSPTAWAGSTWTPTQPFVYLHMFAGGNLTFNKVELSGSGFEFDNLVVSTAPLTPAPQLALVSTFVKAHTVVFEPNGSGVQGAMANQVRNTTGALSTNTFERSGFTFAGWATEADGGGTRYADGAIYDLDADVTLFAQWTAIPNASLDAAAKPRTTADSPPASGADATSATLAATGSNQDMLLGLSALALVLGLSLVAHSRRLRHRAAGGR